MSRHNALDIEHLPQFYDERFSKKYCREHGGRHMAQLSTMLGCVPASFSCQKVLDYGCGSGTCSELLSEFFPDAEIHGIDISSEAIQTARARFPRCIFSSFDGSRVSYSDETFDVIFSSHVLEHVLDLGKSIEEISRLIKKGGYFCLTLPCANEGSLESNLTKLMRGSIIKSATGEDKWCWEDPSHLRRMNSADLIAAFSRVGLQLRQAFYGNQFWGGIESVCMCGPGLILNWLQIWRGKSFREKLSLLIAKAGLLAFSPVFLTKLKLRGKIRQSDGIKKIFYLAAVPLKWIYSPLAKSLGALADGEWERQRMQTGGASQFLVFQKEFSALKCS